MVDYRRIWPLKPKTWIIIGSESINQPQDYYGAGVAKLGVTGFYLHFGVGPVSVPISVPLAQLALGFVCAAKAQPQKLKSSKRWREEQSVKQDDRLEHKMSRVSCRVSFCTSDGSGTRNVRRDLFLVDGGGS